jgi:hypothetical protein
MTQPQELTDGLSKEVGALKSKGVVKRIFKAMRYSIQGFKALGYTKPPFAPKPYSP